MVKSNKKLVKASILGAAAISFLLSVYLWFTGSQDQGIYVGLWVPSILSFGALVFAGDDQT
jgi:spermidine/putrescine-binding protein